MATSSKSKTKERNRRVDYGALLRIGKTLLLALGEDPESPGLRDTPRRFADSWKEFYEYDPGRIETSFPAEAHLDEMVVVRNIPVVSKCEHHLLQFDCNITIAYIQNGKILGLSKLPRIAHKFAHRLQLQERLTNDIAEEVMSVANTKDVAVVGVGRHSCCAARGIKANVEMITSALRGRFKTDSAMRAEFLSFAGANQVKI
jgi:GTP cyclohydrolase I